MYQYQVPLHRLLWHALRLRCPYCGKGRIYSHGFTMNDHCSNCGWIFEREEGYWTGAIAVNLVVAETIAAAIAIPLAIMQVSPASGHGHRDSARDRAANPVLSPLQ